MRLHDDPNPMHVTTVTSSDPGTASHVEELLRQTQQLFRRFEERRLRVTDIVPLREVVFDNMGETAAEIYRGADALKAIFPEPSPAYDIFRAFGPDSTVLDVGAHWGYSAALMRHWGCKAHILAVEAMPFNATALESIRDLPDSNYDFLNAGAGDRVQNLQFFLPVLNGHAVAGLASTGATLTESNAHQILAALSHYPKSASAIDDTIKLASVQVLGLPIDNILDERRHLHPVAAIKMDVEGFEPNALKGAARLFATRKPLLMIESANRNPAVVAVMTSYGYLHAVRRDGQLALHPERAADTFLDGYWLHPHRIDCYRRLGIMSDAPLLADGLIEYRQDGRTKQTTATFFRGSHANFHPTDESLVRDGIGDSVVKGHTPSERFITRDTSIVAFGSCFAANISNHLHSRGYRVLTRLHSDPYVSSMGDGIVNTYAIRQQFEWAWENRQPTTALWHGYDAAAFGYDEEVRRATKTMFDQADVFIITLGLSEVWYDEPTGEVFWRAVPKAAYDESRHKFRLTTVDENTNNLLAIRRLIRQHRPGAQIVVTLSPIPLTATFREMACITANAVSKATLRVAVDQFLSAVDDPHLYYFPSYEIVTALFQNAFMEDRKHPHHHVLEFNMKAFEHYFCEGSLKRTELDDAFTRARKLDQLVGTEGHFSVHRTMNPKAGGATPSVNR